MKAFRRLVSTDVGWEIRARSTPNVCAGELPIQVEGVILPPDSKSAALYVGHVIGPPTARYAGWGPMQDYLSTRVLDLLPLSEEDSVVGGLLIPALSIWTVLENLKLIRHAAVVGEGLLATIAERALGSWGVPLQGINKGADLDLIVDTTGDPARWDKSLSALRREGTVVLLVPPSSESLSFNFYPHVHRRSLRVVAQRWHRPTRTSDEKALYNLRPIISAIVQEGRWVRPLELGDSTLEKGVWWWFEWTHTPDEDAMDVIG